MKKNLHFLSFLKKFTLVVIMVSVSWIVFAQPRTDIRVARCYPNPATSVVNFDFPKNLDKNYTLQIFSFVGKQMVETPVSGNKISITLNDFYRGIYVFQLRDKAGRIVDSGKFQVVK